MDVTSLALPTAPPPIPPSASASSEAGRPSPSRSHGVSSPPSRFSVGEEGRGGLRALVSGGECDWTASSLSGVGVVGPSCSQESPVLARSAPSSVNSSASVERDPRSSSREAGGSSRGRSHSHSSRASLSRDRESGEWRRRARPQSGGSHARFHESQSRFTTRSRYPRRVRSRQGSSHSPSACLQSRRPQSWSSDHSRGRRICLRSRSGCSRS